jgi:hypothetical protein
MIRNAARLGAGLGFFCHAFNHATLQSPAAYTAAEDDLYNRLAELADYARQIGAKSIGIEQMYSPHQIPWTIEGGRKLITKVYGRGRSPFYLTIDTGHQTGQRRFWRPSHEKLKQCIRQVRVTGRIERELWLGPSSAYALFGEAALSFQGQEDMYLQRVEQEMDRYSYLFATAEDGDAYIWLERLACYSPIIHLQQTDGDSSRHCPFTEENNRQGIIRSDRVLQAIACAYSQEPDAGMPPWCEDIYLTLEIFSGTADFPADIISRIAESVEYWRKYVPRDGLRIEELLGTTASAASPKGR